MADKSFGVKELNLLNASGTPTITSPNNLNLNANTVAISTSVTVGQNITVSANAGIASLNVTGIATITRPSTDNSIQRYVITNNSNSDYRFTGPGQDGAENDPDIYLVRGHRYVFTHNATVSHPIQIRVASGGAAYTDGVTYSDTGNNRTTQGNDLIINVQHDAPARLYYQCTSHGGMVGNIYIVGGPQVISGVVTATTFSGSGANLTNLPAANLTGTLPAISGANLTSLPSQVTISNNADDRVITGGSGTNLNGESTMTYTSSLLKLATAASTSTDAELLHLVGGGTSNRGLKISTGRASGAAQNHGAAIYDAINSESSGYGSQHRFKIAGTDCFTIGYNGDFGFVGINDNVPYPDSVGGNTVNTCLELGSPSGTDTASVIKFVGRDGSGNGNKCQIQWAGANNRFDITVNGNQALQIQPNKDVEVTDGDLIIGTSGHGINFSATSDAGGMTSELLDDYEEGSWTPTAHGYTGSNTTNNCFYTKIGRLVIATFRITWPSLTNSAAAEIRNLPFTCMGQAVNTFGGSFAETNDNDNLTMIVQQNTTSLYILRCTSSGVDTQTISEVSGKDFRGTAIYFTSS